MNAPLECLCAHVYGVRAVRTSALRLWHSGLAVPMCARVARCKSRNSERLVSASGCDSILIGQTDVQGVGASRSEVQHKWSNA